MTTTPRHISAIDFITAASEGIIDPPPATDDAGDWWTLATLPAPRPSWSGFGSPEPIPALSPYADWRETDDYVLHLEANYGV